MRKLRPRPVTCLRSEGHSVADLKIIIKCLSQSKTGTKSIQCPANTSPQVHLKQHLKQSQVGLLWPFLERKVILHGGHRPTGHLPRVTAVSREAQRLPLCPSSPSLAPRSSSSPLETLLRPFPRRKESLAAVGKSLARHGLPA